MYNERDDNGNQGANGASFVAGVFTGALIGAAVGLLFAPRVGAELRGQIKDAASAAGQKASETIGAVADAGRTAYQQARDVASTAGDELGRMANDVSRSAEQGVSAIREAVGRPRRTDSGTRA
jgi:gas vesicle protein